MIITPPLVSTETQNPHKNNNNDHSDHRTRIDDVRNKRPIDQTLFVTEPLPSAAILSYFAEEMASCRLVTAMFGFLAPVAVEMGHTLFTRSIIVVHARCASWVEQNK